MIIISDAKLMRKIKHILTGWFLVLIFWDSPKAKKRRAICATCSERVGFVCGSCGCVIAAKSRVKEEECPLDKWTL